MNYTMSYTHTLRTLQQTAKAFRGLLLAHVPTVIPPRDSMNYIVSYTLRTLQHTAKALRGLLLAQVPSVIPPRDSMNSLYRVLWIEDIRMRKMYSNLGGKASRNTV